MMKYFLSFLFLISLSCNTIFAQRPPKEVHQLDFFDLLVKKENRDKKRSDTITVKPHKLYFSILPFVGYNPAMGIAAGFTMNPAIYLGDIATTPISSFAINATITGKSQLLVNVRSNIFSKGAQIILQGDWRLYFYSQPTYGLGSNINSMDTSVFIIHTGDVGYIVSEATYPMKFNYIRFHETVNWKVAGKFYLGAGYHFDYHYNINDEKLNLESRVKVLTPHYLYTLENGFNVSKYIQSGMVMSILYDSRDNSIRPVRGIYVKLIPRLNLTAMGSSKGSITLFSEFRTYIGLSKRNPAHLIAFWYQGCFLLEGKVPYLDLPAIGWDTYNRTGRGYVQGRIRGVNMIYGEAEYRFPISPYSRILSGVLFVNTTTSDDPQNGIHLFNYLAPAGGVGLRVMFNKKIRANLAIDFGVGMNGSKGLFLNLTETF
jgi:hypothetical protein